MNITIIGAGPVGNYTGHLLAKSGHNVDIYEEHSQIGNPIQCTGLLTSDFDQFKFKMDSFLVNTFDTIKVFSPNEELDVKRKEYLVCRTKFDQFFGNLAKKSGAKIHLSHSFIRKEGKDLIIKDLKQNIEKKISPDIVIGADGPLSKVAKAYGFYERSRKNFFGIQAVVEGNFSKGEFKTYFGKDVCPDLFVWVVPESKNTARVGLANTKDTKKLFDNFVKKHNFKILLMQAGTIPIYNPKQKVEFENCYLVGDAATQVKATTLGGLIPGFNSAQILVESINKQKSYKKALLPVRRRLFLHLILHKILIKLSDEDWDFLVKLIRQKRIQKVLETFSRDNPIPLVFCALLLEPRFIYFAKYLRFF